MKLGGNTCVDVTVQGLEHPVHSGQYGGPILDLGKIGPFHQINALKTVVGFGANISAAIRAIIRTVWATSVHWFTR